MILADEPTAALDPAAAGDVCSLLLKAAEDATLLTVVHNTTLLTQLADRVIGLRAGRIAFDLPVDEVDDRALLALYHVDNRRPSERLGVVLPDTMCINTQEQV